MQQSEYGWINNDSITTIEMNNMEHYHWQAGIEAVVKVSSAGNDVSLTWPSPIQTGRF